jgi:hypothetical protein
MRKGASEAGEYMIRYQLLQAFLQTGGNLDMIYRICLIT